MGNAKEQKYAETYGGKIGGVLPLVALIGAIVVLCLAGMSSLRNFWGAGFLAMAVGLIVYKDKNRYTKSILEYAPKNPAAESYRSLAREVLKLA